MKNSQTRAVIVPHICPNFTSIENKDKKPQIDDSRRIKTTNPNFLQVFTMILCLRNTNTGSRFSCGSGISVVSYSEFFCEY